MDGGTDLDDVGIRQDGAETARDAAHVLDAEQEGLFSPGELKEGGSVGTLVRRESGTGLGVKADDLLMPEVVHGLAELLPERIDHMDFAGKGRQFQAPDLFRTNRDLEHTDRDSRGRRCIRR